MKKVTFVILTLINLFCYSQNYENPGLNALKWRMIGPHRGGRTVGASGVTGQPNVFYIGVNNGGVWKTNDAGRTWNPIFDKEQTGSIGDVAVAPSNPKVIYVASGEGLHRPDLSIGKGMYRSQDSGNTWQHIGFDSAQQISGISIDPKNENRLLIAVLGHPYGPNKERGVFRSLDGGKSWDKVLYINENVGATQVTIDPSNSEIVYADMWEHRLAPWENGEWSGIESGLFKSTDGGNSWKKLTDGLPTTQQGLGRIGFCIASSNTNRLYATVDADKEGGIYRSDDAGNSWKRMNPDERYWGRGSDFAEIKADPKNADIVYTASVVIWKSTDGAKTFSAFKGAPGGDDYHRLWINPENPDIILIASDQGAVVTVNGGKTFSSWYNQPTAQFYHVSTDNAFPYNVYGAQQESGSVGIASRSNDGQITFREWHPVGAEEYGYIAADPLNSDIIYGGKITRYNKRTGQIQNISPEIVKSGKYRFIRTAPIVFSPVDNKTLYYAGNVLFKTRDGGSKWEIISPDLSRQSPDVPDNIGIYKSEKLNKMPRRGVIYTVSPSPKDIKTIWCGTDDGQIQLTKDEGKSWKNVTPNSITSWSKLSMIEASHFNVNTAYAAVNRIRLDDMHPHIYKTTDGGRSWLEIIKGLPQDPINSVKEDPLIKGLLFACSETGVYFSLDDGNKWQSIKLNMPSTSVRDLVIKDNDLVIGTHGRSFWILDNISLLRELAFIKNIKGNHLFKPADAYRVRWDVWPDTPLPPDEPAGENPPDGAIIDYFLSNNASSIVLEISDLNHRIIRKYSNKDTLIKIPDLNIPLYWIRPQQILSSTKGGHRFLWDMHYQPLNVPPVFPISAVANNTSPDNSSPWVMPGKYNIRLVIDGITYNQTITIKIDPRVKTDKKDLKIQHDIAYECYISRQIIIETLNELYLIKLKLKEKISDSGKNDAPILNNLLQELEHLEIINSKQNEVSIANLNFAFNSIFKVVEETDHAPTIQTIEAFQDKKSAFKELWKTWIDLKKKITIALAN